MNDYEKLAEVVATTTVLNDTPVALNPALKIRSPRVTQVWGTRQLFLDAYVRYDADTPNKECTLYLGDNQMTIPRECLLTLKTLASFQFSHHERVRNAAFTVFTQILAKAAYTLDKLKELIVTLPIDYDVNVIADAIAYSVYPMDMVRIHWMRYADPAHKYPKLVEAGYEYLTEHPEILTVTDLEMHCDDLYKKAKKDRAFVQLVDKDTMSPMLMGIASVLIVKYPGIMEAQA